MAVLATLLSVANRLGDLTGWPFLRHRVAPDQTQRCGAFAPRCRARGVFGRGCGVSRMCRCCRSQPDAGGNHDHAGDQRRPDGFVLGPRGDRNAEARCGQECHRHRAGSKAPPSLHNGPVGESGRHRPHVGQRCGTLSADFLQRPFERERAGQQQACSKQHLPRCQRQRAGSEAVLAHVDDRHCPGSCGCHEQRIGQAMAAAGAIERWRGDRERPQQPQAHAEHSRSRQTLAQPYRRNRHHPNRRGKSQDRRAARRQHGECDAGQRGVRA